MTGDRPHIVERDNPFFDQAEALFDWFESQIDLKLSIAAVVDTPLPLPVDLGGTGADNPTDAAANLFSLDGALGSAATHPSTDFYPWKLYHPALKGWSLDLSSTSSTKLLTAGVELFVRVPVPETINGVANVVCEVTTAGATVAHGYVTMYKSDGTFIAQSAEQTTTWQSTGAKVVPVAAGTIVGGPGGFVFVSFYVGIAGTAPAFRAGSAAVVGLMTYGQGAASGWRVGTLARSDVAGWTSNVDPGAMSASASVLALGIA